MPVFAVVLNEPNGAVARRVEDKYPNHYRMNDAFFLAQGEGIAQTVSEAVGIKGDERVEEAHGGVFKISHSCSGFTSRALWDWPGQAEEREVVG